VTCAAVIGLALCGPILQPAHYHEFADGAAWSGVSNAANVLSNIGFAVVGLWGLWRIAPARHDPAIAHGWPGHMLFLVGLVLVAFGSGFYHLAPDDGRLLWDRLPIALASAGLLAGTRAETRSDGQGALWAGGLAVVAVASVVWSAEQISGGDLRPYLLLQGLALVLMPLWQALYGSLRRDRVAVAVAIALYVLARLAEVYDHELFVQLGGLSGLSGHTLKHLLATAAAGVLTWRLIARLRRD
jgi:hypothetical protein